MKVPASAGIFFVDEVGTKKKGPDRNPARFKIQYPMKNQCNDKAYYSSFSILWQILNKRET